MSNIVDRIRTLFEQHGADAYFGEPVSQLAHALQTARCAESAGADEALIVAALLHDIGHLLHGCGEDVAQRGCDAEHEAVGQAWLTQAFGPEVCEPVRLHVAAKRYLCAVDAAYAGRLSDASRQSLELQGGAFDVEAARRFGTHPFAGDAVRLRRWDDAAKCPDLTPPPLEHFLSYVEDLVRGIDLVVFDMAGTTVIDDGVVGGALCAALAEHSVVAPREEVNRVMGWPKPAAIRFLLERWSTTADAPLVDAVHARFEERMLVSAEVAREVPGASELFSELGRARIRVALDTGFSRRIADRMLSALGWGPPLVLTVVTSDEVERGRPAPDLVLEAMARTCVTQAERVAKVGDTPSDLQEGVAAGCGLVIGVTTGTHNRYELMDVAHTHLVDDLRDVLDLVRVHVPGRRTINQ